MDQPPNYELNDKFEKRALLSVYGLCPDGVDEQHILKQKKEIDIDIDKRIQVLEKERIERYKQVYKDEIKRYQRQYSIFSYFFN